MRRLLKFKRKSEFYTKNEIFFCSSKRLGRQQTRRIKCYLFKRLFNIHSEALIEYLSGHKSLANHSCSIYANAILIRNVSHLRHIVKTKCTQRYDGTLSARILHYQPPAFRYNISARRVIGGVVAYSILLQQ